MAGRLTFLDYFLTCVVQGGLRKPVRTGGNQAVGRVINVSMIALLVVAHIRVLVPEDTKKGV